MKSKLISFAMMAVTALMVTSSSAQSSDTAVTPSVCDVVGTIVRLNQVQRSPWTDGTPSTMMTVETHLSVHIDDRTPHDKDAAADDPCHKKIAGEKRTYKLCSPTPVKQGDRIHGTEGTQTGSAYVVGCLFDLVVLPPKQ